MPYLQANTNNPFGFMPVENGDTPAETHVYYVSTSQGAHAANSNFSILPGDVVVLQSSSAPGLGYVAPAASGGISLSGTGTAFIVGVAAQSGPVNPASATAILVYDDPDQVFVVQDNGSATAGMGSSAGCVGVTFSFTATATSGGRSTDTGNSVHSNMVLQSSGYITQAITAGSSGSNQTNPILVLNMHPIEFTPNAAASSIVPTASGQWRKWLVKFRHHALQSIG